MSTLYTPPLSTEITGPAQCGSVKSASASFCAGQVPPARSYSAFVYTKHAVRPQLDDDRTAAVRVSRTRPEKPTRGKGKRIPGR